MLPTFVIGLREGLEASLIVGIIATFLGQQGRRDVMRWVWVGVGIAVTLCGAAAVALKIAEENLPQKEQEGLETVIGLLAVAMVTWMIVWMRKHARGLKHDLEGKAAAALAGGSVGTLVFMAFLAVLREGLETAVFLLAAFQGSRDPGGGRHRRDARCRRRGRDRNRDLPRRSPAQHGEVLPLHRFRARARRRGARRHRRAHRARSRLAQRRSAPGARPHVVGRPRVDPLRAAHGHARHPGPSGHRRSARAISCI